MLLSVGAALAFAPLPNDDTDALTRARRARDASSAALRDAPAARVIEAEDGQLVSGWRVESRRLGHEGSGYVRSLGPAEDLTAPVAGLAFEVDLPRTGTYELLLSTWRADPTDTALWLRLDGGGWTAISTLGSPGWTWATLGGRDHAPRAVLQAGEHTIELAAATADVLVDRLLVVEQTGETAGDTYAAYAVRQRHSDLLADPPEVPRGDDHQTAVTLDAEALLPLAAAGGLSFHWEAPGAAMLQQDGALAEATFPGDALEPIMVHLVDGNGAIQHSSSMMLGTPGLDWTMTGIARTWHTLQFAFPGPGSNQLADDPNPFLDFRLQVTFTGPAGQVYVVPGFFGGDGQGGPAGNTWMARFTPDSGGLWNFDVSFRQGENVSISLDAEAGLPSHFDSLRGKFRVMRADPEGPGFIKHGRLEYVGEHYLKFRNGSYFIKGGTDSPENFLAYEGFDGIDDMGNVGIVHEYEPHVADWNPGDPDFVSDTTGYDGKAIIGALNYLSSVGVNSIYFLPMNLGGDGRDTCPFVAYPKSAFNKTHYDLGRMEQWRTVFDHAQRKGVMLHFVLAETESGNERWLDEGELGIERKLYFRELVARFGHALALKWNLCEEADFFNEDDLRNQAEYLQALDPYDHPICYHSFTNNVQDYAEVSGESVFSASAVQYHIDDANDHVEWLRDTTAAAGHKWVVDMDENAPAGLGLTNGNADDLRKRALYDVYFSGGNIEWYAGYHSLPLGGDVKMEDFRTREEMWNFMRYAREFMQQNMPFWDMQPADGLLSGESATHGGGQVFSLPTRAWAIYLPDASPSGTIDLSDSIHDELELQWFNPRSGAVEGTVQVVAGGAPLALGAPPSDPDQDWVCWIRPALDADPSFLGIGGYSAGLPDGMGSAVDLDNDEL